MTFGVLFSGFVRVPMSTAPTHADRSFRFGPYEVSERVGALTKNGTRIKLQDQPFRVLLELLNHAGDIVTREELQQKLWPADTFVDFDTGLNTAIRKIRQALLDDADRPRYIETIAKRGYRFVAPVEHVAITEAREPSSQFNRRKEDVLRFVQPRAARRLNWKIVVIVAAVAGALALWKWWPIGERTEQRITSNPEEAPVLGAVISPDGKYLAYADPTGVYVREIASGEMRALEVPQGGGVIPTSWYPDSTHVLLSARELNDGVESVAPRKDRSVWRVSILGGLPQLVLQSAYEGSVSPDGSQIAFLRGDGYDGRQIWVADADGQNAHALMPSSEAERVVSNLSWSPRGQRLAYLRIAEPEEISSLETMDVQTRSVTVIKSGVRFASSTWWAADGRLLYGWRPENVGEQSRMAVYAVHLNERTGEPAAPASKLSEALGEPAAISASISTKHIAVLRKSEFPQAFVADMEQSTGKLQNVRRLTLDENMNVPSAWTVDSNSVAFISNRRGVLNVFSQALDQNVPTLVAEANKIGMVRLAPDGTHFLYVVNADHAAKRPAVVMSVPVSGGPPRALLQQPEIYDIQCARAPSKLCLVGISGHDKAQELVFDPDDGKTRHFKVQANTLWLEWSLSPDGKTLAVIVPGPKLRFIDIETNASREFTLGKWERLLAVDWMPDNNSVLVSTRKPDGGCVILRVDLNGQDEVVFAGGKVPRVLWAIPSPDAHHVLINAVTGENNVWMLDN